MIRLLIVVTVGLAACTPPRRMDAPAPPVDATRIKHETHTRIPCGNCHRASPSSPSRIARPGSDDHRPCDDGACHQKDFLGAPTKLCDACHDPIKLQPALSAPLKKYPVEDPWQALPPVFSHKKHLDAGLMEKRVGFHVACADCHNRGDGSFVRPNHATCARCHAAEVALPNAPRMEDCTTCHRGSSRERVRARVKKGDIKFAHERHRTDIKGAPIRCEQCHGRSAKSNTYEDHAAPRIEACVNCHDDTKRVPYQLRMRVCETCHREKTATLTALAPRNHLPATERPLDHTLAFRRDHAEAAERETARCATCHVCMSGNPRQACDECHQKMLPSDHRITFRELDHGPEAVADRTRCATCHVVEFCTSCHSQRPRSHGVARDFGREHDHLARLNLRACITCHKESFCSQSGCHGDGARVRP